MTFLQPEVIHGLASKILVIPIVSIANVGQLAVDILIASLSLKRYAAFDPSYFIPAVGGREDGQPGVTLPLELYGSENSPLFVLQQRSPVLKSHKQLFVEELLRFGQSSGVAAIIFLSGLDVINRTDGQMLTPTYRILPSQTPLTGTPLAALASLPIPPYTEAGVGNIPAIPGGGLTRRILTSLPDSWSIPTVALLQFALEGDNRFDAQLLASVVTKVVGANPLTWVQPGSWNQGLFGAPPDQNLYG